MYNLDYRVYDGTEYKLHMNSPCIIYYWSKDGTEYKLNINSPCIIYYWSKDGTEYSPSSPGMGCILWGFSKT